MNPNNPSEKRYLVVVGHKKNNITPNNEPIVIGDFSTVEDYVKFMYPHLDDVNKFEIFDTQEQRFLLEAEISDAKVKLEEKLKTGIEPMPIHSHFLDNALKWFN